MGTFIEFIISILITAVIYMGIPLLISLFISTPIYRKTMKRIVVICVIVEYLILSFIYFTMDLSQTANMCAAVLWGTIAKHLCYEILDKHRKLRDTLEGEETNIKKIKSKCDVDSSFNITEPDVLCDMEQLIDIKEDYSPQIVSPQIDNPVKAVNNIGRSPIETDCPSNIESNAVPRFCWNCGASLLPNSIFCVNCGIKLSEKTKSEKRKLFCQIKRCKELFPLEIDGEDEVPIKKSINNNKFRVIFPWLLSTVLFLVILVASLYFFFQYKPLHETADVNSVSERENNTQQSTIIDDATSDEAALYEKLIGYASGRSIGYSSSGFHVDQGLIAIKVGSSKTLRLWTDVAGYNDVVYNASVSGEHVVSVEWNKTEWNDDMTTLTVEGLSKGVSLLTFTNDFNDEKVFVIIAVYE